RAEDAHVVPETHRLTGGQVQCGVAVEQAVQGEESLGACGVQLREVEQGRSPQGAGDLAVLPPRLGAAHAVALELGGSDQGDVAYLSGQRDAVVGKSQEGSELFDVV